MENPPSITGGSTASSSPRKGIDLPLFEELILHGKTRYFRTRVSVSQVSVGLTKYVFEELRTTQLDEVEYYVFAHSVKTLF